MIKKQVVLIDQQGRPGRRGQRVIDGLKNGSLTLVCCVWAVAIAPAQSISGRITGSVTDQAGAVIRNAAVSLTNEGTGAERHATTDEKGLYVVPELPVGFYTLKVEGGSFAPATRTSVKVDVGAETRVNVMLTLQAAKEALDIRAEAPLLQPGSSALAEAVNNKQVDALPINGRDYRRLTTLVAGAAPRPPPR